MITIIAKSRLESARPTCPSCVHSQHSSLTPTPSELTSSSLRNIICVQTRADWCNCPYLHILYMYKVKARECPGHLSELCPLPTLEYLAYTVRTALIISQEHHLCASTCYMLECSAHLSELCPLPELTFSSPRNIVCANTQTGVSVLICTFYTCKNSRLESARPTCPSYVHSRHSSVTPTPSELTFSSPRNIVCVQTRAKWCNCPYLHVFYTCKKSRLESARPTCSGYVHSRRSSVTPTLSELTSSSARDIICVQTRANWCNCPYLHILYMYKVKAKECPAHLFGLCPLPTLECHAFTVGTDLIISREHHLCANTCRLV
ncbi:hypothetical protein J6590_029111 [Homalodisca vitripennis]|nr:hypothetical protein J6590_029111 [Homalodisca vitripennis]